MKVIVIDFRSFFITLKFFHYDYIRRNGYLVMITIKEMAEILGISPTTVSNVINGKTSEVSRKTAEKVQKLLEEYDYVPNMNARNLAQNHSRLIGIVLKSRKDKYENIFADPFHGELLGALESAIRANGYYMMLYTSEDIDEIVRNVVSWNAEGLILIGMLHDDYLRIKSKYKRPLVLIDSYTPKNIAKYVNIGLQDEEGGYLITKYLLECGHRKIAFLADNVEGVDYIRYNGHQRAFQEYGLDADVDDLIVIRPSKYERQNSMQEIYEVAHKYTAFVCCSDYYAVTLMKYLRKRGLRIPEDISITGFDDNLYAQIVTPTLTTIHQDVSQRGRLAVEYLFKLINGWAAQTTNVFLPVHLVVRESVKVLNTLPKKQD